MFTLLFKLLKFATDLILAIMVPVWILVAQIIIVWMIVVLCIPGMNVADELYSIILYWVVTPMEYTFNHFYAVFDNVSHMNWDVNNPVEDAYYLMKLIFSIIFALGLPILIIIGWLLAAFTALVLIDKPSNRLGVMSIFAGDGSNPITNAVHVMSSHTTIQDTFNAEVQANAIASAMKK